MLLAGKRILITGVLDTSSISFHVARIAQEEGAEILLTSFGRTKRLTERVASRLPYRTDVLDFDATSPADALALRQELESRWDSLDGVVHSIAAGPPGCFGDSVFSASWDDVSSAMHVSAYSLKVLVEATVGLMVKGGSIVGFDFDASQAWPVYNWMGVAKSALEATSRYLAREVGPRRVRVNLIASGPLQTFSARAMAGAGGLADLWADRAPLGWNMTDPSPVARAGVALLSDWFTATTGEIIHVDGGFHSQAV